jgi:hypothetical protein
VLGEFDQLMNPFNLLLTWNFEVQSLWWEGGAKIVGFYRCWISLVLVGKRTLECFLISQCGLQLICKDIV